MKFNENSNYVISWSHSGHYHTTHLSAIGRLHVMLLASGQICLIFSPTTDMKANILTKLLTVTDFLKHRDLIEMLIFKTRY